MLARLSAHHAPTNTIRPRRAVYVPYVREARNGRQTDADRPIARF